VYWQNIRVLKVQPGKTFRNIKLKIGEIKMKSKVCKVILMFALVMGFGLCLLNGEDHYWKFNETSGNIANDSLDHVNGTLNGCAAFLPGSEGVYLNGTDSSFVTFGKSVGQFGTDDFSVYLDFKTNEKYRYFDIVGNRTAPSHGNFLSIRMTGKHEKWSEGILVVEVDEDESGKNHIVIYSGKSGLNDGYWHTLVVVRIGKNLALYIDGNPDRTGTSATGIANIKNGNDFKLGRSLVDSQENKFTPNAVYKNLYVYDRALTQNEIKEMFEKSKKK
jgi:hypothetical protein